MSLVYFLENYDRLLLAVSPVPYIDPMSYKYSLLQGPLFTILYTTGGVLFSLYIYSKQQSGGAVGKQFERKICLAVACVVFSIATLLTAVVSTFWQQALLRMLLGLGQVRKHCNYDLYTLAQM